MFRDIFEEKVDENCMNEIIKFDNYEADLILFGVQKLFINYNKCSIIIYGKKYEQELIFDDIHYRFCTLKMNEKFRKLFLIDFLISNIIFAIDTTV